MPSFVRILSATCTCIHLLLPLSITPASGHGFLSTPRSRNLVAYEDRLYHNQISSTPYPEDCPTCINRGGSLARCGILNPGAGLAARNYDFPKNAFGAPMPPNPQMVYEEGEVIDVEVVLSAHHKGHFVFKACPIEFTNVSPTQACFDQHPLLFQEDLFYGAPIDPNYPERAYVAPAHHPNKQFATKPPYEEAMLFHFRLRLPEGVSGDLVLIQWYYVAGNSGCAHDGYAEYPWPEDWILNMDEDEETSLWESKVSVGTGLKSCAELGVLPPDGLGTPEQFWNCAEVSIKPRELLMSAKSDTLVRDSSSLEGNEQFQSEKTIIGYWASWQWYDRGKLAEPWAFDYRKYTRVNFAFFQINEQGDIWGTDSWADPNTLFGPYNWNGVDGVDPEYCSWDYPHKKVCQHHHYEKGLLHLVKAAGAEIWPSIGGWSLSDPFPVMAKNANARANFANKCVELIEAYGFDGIDIDWEYPGYEAHSGTPDDTLSYNLLLKDIREKLEELGARTGKFYGLTAALPCGTNHINNIDIPTAAKYLTELNLMTYDFFGAWSPTTGVNAPLWDQNWGGDDVIRYSIDGCVKNWVEGGGSPDAINIGLPFYGRGYVEAKHFNETHTGKPDTAMWSLDEGSPQYFNIINKLPELVSIRHELTATQYAYNPKTVNGIEVGGMVSYDDEEAICDKTQYCLEHDLNGFIIWEMSGDLMDDLSTPLIDAVHAKLRDPSLDCRAFRYDKDTFAEYATPLGNEIAASFPPKPKPPISEDASEAIACPTAWHWGSVPLDECHSYFQCTNGVPSIETLTHCAEGELFDMGSEGCKDASQVTCLQTGSPTADDVTASEFSFQPDCPASFSNYKAGPDCTSYYRCHNGALVSSINGCPPGTLFDENISACNFEDAVQCRVTADSTPYLPAADSTPDLLAFSEPAYEPECPASVSSFMAAPDCTSYYRCHNGAIVLQLTACPPGTLFDVNISACNSEGAVECAVTSAPTPLSTPQPTRHPTTSQPTQNPVTDDPTRHPTTSHPTQNPVTRDPTRRPTTSHPTQNPVTDDPTRRPSTYNPTRHPVTSEPTRRPVTNEPTKRPTNEPVQSIQIQSKPLTMPQTPRPPPPVVDEPLTTPTANAMANSHAASYVISPKDPDDTMVQPQKPTKEPTRRPRMQRTRRPTRTEGTTIAEGLLSKPTPSYIMLPPSETSYVEYNTSPSKGEEHLGDKIQNQIQQHTEIAKKAKNKMVLKKGTTKRGKKKKGTNKRNKRKKKSRKSSSSSKSRKGRKSPKSKRKYNNKVKTRTRETLN